MQSPERALKEAEMCPRHSRNVWKTALTHGPLGWTLTPEFLQLGEKKEQLIIVDKKFCFILTILLTLKGTRTGHDMKRERSLSDMVYLSNSVFMPGRMRHAHKHSHYIFLTVTIFGPNHMTDIDGQHEPSVLSVWGGFVLFVLAN